MPNYPDKPCRTPAAWAGVLQEPYRTVYGERFWGACHLDQSPGYPAALCRAVLADSRSGPVAQLPVLPLTAPDRPKRRLVEIAGPPVPLWPPPLPAPPAAIRRRAERAAV